MQRESQSVHTRYFAFVIQRITGDTQVFGDPLPLIGQRQCLKCRRSAGSQFAVFTTDEVLRERECQRIGALNRAVVGELLAAEQNILPLPDTVIDDGLRRNRQISLREQCALLTVTEILQQRHRQRIKTSQRTTVIHLRLLDIELAGLHGAAVGQPVTVQREVAFTEQGTAVFQRFCADLHRAMAHQFAGIIKLMADRGLK